jgi:hypothetical protein
MGVCEILTANHCHSLSKIDKYCHILWQESKIFLGVIDLVLNEPINGVEGIVVTKCHSS